MEFIPQGRLQGASHLSFRLADSLLRHSSQNLDSELELLEVRLTLARSGALESTSILSWKSSLFHWSSRSFLPCTIPSRLFEKHSLAHLTGKVERQS